MDRIALRAKAVDQLDGSKPNRNWPFWPKKLLKPIGFTTAKTIPN